MSERYSKLYSLPENLYAEGSPVIIAAGSLLKDNQTGNVLAQIKYKSVSDEKIIALMVKIKAFDVTGKELQGVEEYQYLDLNVGINQEFGQKTAVVLPENITRSFECEVTAVIFADDTNWKNNGVKWESLPKQEILKEKLGELNEQYLRDTECEGELCPMEYKNIWLCTCGFINKKGEEKCFACSAEKAKIFSALNTDLLTEHKNEYDRLREEERRKKEAEEKEQQIKAEAEAKRNKKIAGIAFGVVTLSIAFIVLLTKVIIPSVDKNMQYKSAVALMDGGEFEKAIAVFKEIQEYKDSKNMASKIVEEHPELPGLNMYIKKVGEYITFGSYEQDNNAENGKEEIEWLVLAKENNKLLVISKNALDCKPYNATKTAVTWETCTLRKWLNNEFINNAFNDAEKAKIPTVTVTADANPEDSTNPGNTTQDKVFLLSIAEANKYFSSDNSRQCKTTAYAKAQGAYVSSSNGNCWWWLRSPGYYRNIAALVSYDGDVGELGDVVSISISAVRPALWISLE